MKPNAVPTQAVLLPLTLLFLAPLCAAVPLPEDAPRLLVSTSSGVPAGAGLPAVDDVDVLLVQDGAPPRHVRRQGHWLAAAGLPDPGDVDALARRPGELPGTYRALAFSLLSNVAGLLDGDVLGLADGGGVEILVPEEAIAQALGVAGASIDVDAVAWDAGGRLCLSLQSDLDGTLLGTVRNGDVLRLLPGGGVERVLTEAEVDAKASLAAGAPQTVGDVHGIEWVEGELWVAIQSPSDLDGGVLACGAAPTFVLTEAGAGLGGEELDALTLAGDADVLPTVALDPQEAPSGGTVHVEFRGEPGGVLLVMYAGDAGFFPFGGASGFGAWYMDVADPWLNSILLQPAMPLVPLDGQGAYGIDYDLPAGTEGIGLAGELGWSFQVIDLGSLVVSEPFRVRTF
ncbi:MAG: hypothetical protein AAF682_27880 [Planctomycetota bacterium]